jgi:hypothetical protein
MADGTTKYGDINQRTAGYAAADMLRHAEPYIVLSRMGLTKPMPKNKAQKIIFRRAVPLAAATTPVVEGVTPTAQKISRRRCACAQAIRRPIEITDKVTELSEDPVLDTATMLAGEQAAATIEQVLYGVLKAGTNVFYANGASRAAVNTALTLNKQRAGHPCAECAEGQEDHSRAQVGRPSMACRRSKPASLPSPTPTLKSDIRNLDGFIPVAKYGARQPLNEHEIGSVENVRYLLSPDLGSFADAGGAKGSMVSTSGTSADVYPILFFGQDAFAQVPLKGEEAIVPMVLNPGNPSKSDPMAQRGYVSWKTWYAAVILNDLWMARLEVAVTAL